MIIEADKALSDLQSDLNYHLANGDLPRNIRLELGELRGKLDDLLGNLEQPNG